MRSEEPGARRWYTTFLLLHGAMAAGATVLAAAGDRDEGLRVDMTFNAISSSLAFLSMLTVTPPLIGAGGTLASMPSHTPEQRLRKLREAEDVLRRETNALDFLDGWLAVTGVAVYTTAASSTLLIAFDRPSAAYTTVLGGIVLGHGRLLLRPRAARRLWRRYRRRHPDAACEETAQPPPAPAIHVGVRGLGVGVTIRF